MSVETPDGEEFEGEGWFTRFMRARRNEAAGLILAAAGVFLVGAVLTYNPYDPSLNVASGQAVQNGFGAAGAIAADAALQWLGWAGAALGVMMLAWGAIFVVRGPVRRGPKIVTIRFVATAMAVAGLAAAAASLPVPATWPFATGLGGALGDVFHGRLAGLLSAAGAPFASQAAGVFGLACGMIGLFAGYGVTPADVSDAAETARRFGTRTRRAAQRAADRYVKGLSDEVVRLEPISETARRGGYDTLPSPEQAVHGRPHYADTEAAPFAGHAQDAWTPAPQTYPTSHESAAPPAAPPCAPEPTHAAGPTPPPHPVAQPTQDAQPAPRPAPSIPADTIVRPPAPGFTLPPLDLLTPPVPRGDEADEAMLIEMSDELETVLMDFGVKGQVVNARAGPVVTLFEFEPAPGVKSSRVITLADDIARSMSAVSARVAVVPGRNVIGIELPTPRRETVFLRRLLSDRTYVDRKNALPLALGETIGGEPFVADLARMPHLLIAGTTGSGKSVGINAMILSLMYRLPPERCRFLMIDPKMLELSVYDGAPHLLTPVVTDPRKAVSALKWVVREMEARYRRMSALGVRNIGGFNRRVEDVLSRGEPLERSVQTGFDPETGKPIFETTEIACEPMPYIVVVIDEMADLMLVAGKDIEAAVQRLAQMARAAGIHLITATQRPSVDVITGTIKANFPTRISFQVTSKIDSRTILGEQGAEQLLGQGDLLFMAPGGRIRRLHGPFVSDEEVERIAAFLKAQGAPEYVDGVTDDPEEQTADLLESAGVSDDPQEELYDRAVALVTQDRRASTSYLQRRLQIGYNRAATLMERLEADGVVSPANAAGKREVLANAAPEI